MLPVSSAGSIFHFSKILKLKILLLLLTLTTLAIRDSCAQWYSQNSGTQAYLHSVFFIDKFTGWSCGFESVLKTTDGGITWTNTFLPGNHKSVFFNDASKGWICGENGKLFRTTNGGTNWEAVSSGVGSTLNSITFLNSLFGVIVGNNKVIQKTTNGGINWESINNIGRQLDIFSVKIITANTIVTTANESYIFRSSNGGISWDSLSFGMPNPLLTVEFVDENTGWVSGCCGMYLKTTDAGLNWSPEIYLTLGFSIHSLKFINASTGFAAGDAGYILRTTDGGNTWDSLNSGTTRDLHSVYFINKDTGISVGHNGMILRTVNGGGPGVPIGITPASSETIPESIFLYQNFPNPFNPSTVISFDLKNESHVSLIVYDINGRVIDELMSERKSPGTYSVVFNRRDLSAGIYFYRIAVHSDKLTSGYFSETKSMLLIK